MSRTLLITLVFEGIILSAFFFETTTSTNLRMRSNDDSSFGQNQCNCSCNCIKSLISASKKQFLGERCRSSEECGQRAICQREKLELPRPTCKCPKWHREAENGVDCLPTMDKQCHYSYQCSNQAYCNTNTNYCTSSYHPRYINDFHGMLRTTTAKYPNTGRNYLYYSSWRARYMPTTRYPTTRNRFIWADRWRKNLFTIPTYNNKITETTTWKPFRTRQSTDISTRKPHYYYNIGPRNRVDLRYRNSTYPITSSIEDDVSSFDRYNDSKTPLRRWCSNNNECGHEAQCRNTDHGYQCQCLAGYRESSDGVNCLESPYQCYYDYQCGAHQYCNYLHFCRCFDGYYNFTENGDLNCEWQYRKHYGAIFAFFATFLGISILCLVVFALATLRRSKQYANQANASNNPDLGKLQLTTSESAALLQNVSIEPYH